MDAAVFNSHPVVRSVVWDISARELYDFMGDVISESQCSVPLDVYSYYTSEYALSCLPTYGELSNPQAYCIQNFYSTLMEVSGRAWRYLNVICWRELRHFGSRCSASLSDLREWLEGKGYASEEVTLFLHTVKAVSSIPISDHIPGIPAVRAWGMLVDTFKIAGWSSAYGGVKWAAIAQVVLDVLSGEYSVMLAADRAYSLEHNTGNIFNKPCVFHTPSTDRLKVMLDIQKSGQMHLLGFNQLEELSVLPSIPTLIMDWFEKCKTVRRLFGISLINDKFVWDKVVAVSEAAHIYSKLKVDESKIYDLGFGYRAKIVERV